MPNTNRRPFVAIGAGITSKRKAERQARSLTKGHPQHIYKPTAKQPDGMYYVKRAS